MLVEYIIHHHRKCHMRLDGIINTSIHYKSGWIIYIIYNTAIYFIGVVTAKMN